MSESLLKELAELKARVEAAVEGTDAFREAVNRYNGVLDLVFIGLNKPLPSEYEIRDKYLLAEYRDFKKAYQEEGPYTIRQLIRDCDVVALVEVRSVRRRGSTVSVNPVELYKGQLEQGARITVPLSWMPDPWFRKGERALIFGTRDDDEVVAFGFKGRMPIVSLGDDEYAACWDAEPEFWAGIAARIERGRTLVSWPVLRNLLREEAERSLRPHPTGK